MCRPAVVEPHQVKAHHHLNAEFASTEQFNHAVGNEAADKAAKQAAQQLAKPSSAEVEKR